MLRPFAGMAVLATVVYFLRPFLSYETPLSIVWTSAVLGAAGMLSYCTTVGVLWKLSGEPQGIESAIAGLVRKILKRGDNAAAQSTAPAESQD